jgi:hypothetical protein
MTAKANKRDTSWLAGLSHKDWLFDGYPIKGERMLERFGRLDLTQARIDFGPSVAGNLGPYWHVPLPEDETVHRLYPKVLETKWLPLIRQACLDYAEWAPRYARQRKAFDKKYPGLPA